MTTEKQAVKVLADSFVKALRNIVDENNKTYVNPQIVNYKGGAGGSGSFSGSIDVSQVRGLYNYMAGKLSDAIADKDQSVSRIITSLQGIASLEVHNLVTDTANIGELYATYGEFIRLVAQEATIGDLDVAAIKANLADIGLAKIGTARISSAQIDVSSSNTAFVREGVGGKYYIDNLAVTDANITSLAAGEIMLKDSDGDFVRLVVDQQGNVSSEKVSYSGDLMENGSLNGNALTNNTVAAGKIIENSITARELNASSIFAKNATIMDLIAANINAVNLFANTGIIPQLKSSIISAIGQDTTFNSELGSGINISQNASITLAQDLIELMVKTEAEYEGDTDYTDISQSKLVLTDKMINAIGDKISLIADEIDLSGNDTVQITSENQISASVKNGLDLSENASITLLKGLIGMMVSNQSATSAIALTPEMIIAISNNITISAENIEAIASQINLEANDSVHIVVGNELDEQLETHANEIAQIVAASTEFEDLEARVTLNEDRYTIAINSVSKNENSIETINSELQTMNTWFTFSEDGFSTGKSGSTYSTLTDDSGFHILQLGEKIGSFAKRQLKVEEVRVGVVNTTERRCVIREASDGGLIITPEGLI